MNGWQLAKNLQESRGGFCVVETESCSVGSLVFCDLCESLIASLTVQVQGQTNQRNLSVSCQSLQTPREQACVDTEVIFGRGEAQQADKRQKVCVRWIKSLRKQASDRPASVLQGCLLCVLGTTLAMTLPCWKPLSIPHLTLRTPSLFDPSRESFLDTNHI